MQVIDELQASCNVHAIDLALSILLHLPSEQHQSVMEGGKHTKNKQVITKNQSVQGMYSNNYYNVHFIFQRLGKRSVQHASWKFSNGYGNKHFNTDNLLGINQNTTMPSTGMNLMLDVVNVAI